MRCTGRLGHFPFLTINKGSWNRPYFLTTRSGYGKLAVCACTLQSKASNISVVEFFFLPFRYAAILFKKQRYVSGQHKMNIKIVCKDNFKYEVQERAATNAVSLQQLAEEYWRIDKFFLISFPILFFIFNIIYWLAFILWIEV